MTQLVADKWMSFLLFTGKQPSSSYVHLYENSNSRFQKLRTSDEGFPLDQKQTR